MYFYWAGNTGWHSAIHGKHRTSNVVVTARCQQKQRRQPESFSSAFLTEGECCAISVEFYEFRIIGKITSQKRQKRCSVDCLVIGALRLCGILVEIRRFVCVFVLFWCACWFVVRFWRTFGILIELFTFYSQVIITNHYNGQVKESHQPQPE